MEFFYGFYLKVASSPAVHFMEDSLAGIHVSMHNLVSQHFIQNSLCFLSDPSPIIGNACHSLTD